MGTYRKLTVLALFLGVSAMLQGQQPVAAAPVQRASAQPRVDASADADSAATATTETDAKTRVDLAKPPAQLPATVAAPASFDLVIDRTVAREHELIKQLYAYTPLIETYLQEMKADPDLGQVPSKDQYYMGRLA